MCCVKFVLLSHSPRFSAKPVKINFSSKLHVDITDELEGIKTDEELTTSTEDRDETEKDGEIHVYGIIRKEMR